MDISSRVPKWGHLLPVYGVIVLLVYGWTLYWFLWKFPSWLYFLTIGEILAALSYSIVTNFLESIAVLALPVMLSLALPKKWFFEVFVARTTAMVVPGLAFMMYIAMQFQTRDDYPRELIKWSPMVALGIAGFAFLIGQVPTLRRALEFLADRAAIFVYLSIPLSLVALIAVLARLIF